MTIKRFWRVILAPQGDVWMICRENGIIAIGYPDYPDDINVVRFKDEMNIGDGVVAYLKDWHIGGGSVQIAVVKLGC